MRSSDQRDDLAIDAKGITKKFGQLAAVSNMNLQVPKGHIYGFLGPNGCGKSTSIRMLTGLLTPSAGTIEVLGMSIPKQAEALRLRIGYMTQKFSLYDDLTVKENLEFIAQIYCLSPNDSRKKIDQLLSTYNLIKQQKQFAGTLSGGQKQRLSLACACLNDPELLFLDEPTSAVDPQNRRDFWEQLFDLSETGTSILVTTHYMDEAERCHALAIMEQGFIRANGSPNELMQQMGANVLEVGHSNLRQLKNTLMAFKEIKSAAQLGSCLRVLVDDKILDPDAWLRQALPELKQAEIRLTPPNLEDVFVTVTGQQSAEPSAPELEGS
ncbi:ABC transporter ATP-binding protein [Shewanella sp. D64]|uniref:ABC transporter ATP-binding protein n=1 Tax=unclassified Shewanella TaxID=196818 RepID=UPI0022BA63C0|nr:MULTISPECIES: ABC transporter ATP-binding protein [unclassified Shewanella]MEC4725497.1 ABC transporter ATP-binding protein [Shewanella sp. D64]MEC4738684.1 ABC transporter ATP-binding protein [Shewanella sp. E94]WBJ94980.1 ABC transporter ATP-binding protein [Shewanella sp. MTB7]